MAKTNSPESKTKQSPLVAKPDETPVNLDICRVCQARVGVTTGEPNTYVFLTNDEVQKCQGHQGRGFPRSCLMHPNR